MVKKVEQQWLRQTLCQYFGENLLKSYTSIHFGVDLRRQNAKQ